MSPDLRFLLAQSDHEIVAPKIDPSSCGYRIRSGCAESGASIAQEVLDLTWSSTPHTSSCVQILPPSTTDRSLPVGASDPFGGSQIGSTFSFDRPHHSTPWICRIRSHTLPDSYHLTINFQSIASSILDQGVDFLRWQRMCSSQSRIHFVWGERRVDIFTSASSSALFA